MPLGGLISLAVLLPNLLMFILPPDAVPPRPEKKDGLMKIMEGVERAGQVGSLTYRFSTPCRRCAKRALILWW